MVFEYEGIAETYVICPKCGLDFSTNLGAGAKEKCPHCGHEDTIPEGGRT